MSSLRPPLDRVDEETIRALDLVSRVQRSAEVPSHYIAELVLIRTFAVFEDAIEDSACRMVCGAAYCDGNVPSLLRARPTRGRERALREMQILVMDQKLVLGVQGY